MKIAVIVAIGFHFLYGGQIRNVDCHRGLCSLKVTYHASAWDSTTCRYRVEYNRARTRIVYDMKPLSCDAESTAVRVTPR